jgi:hypothetical protein
MGTDDGGIDDQVFELWIIRHRRKNAPPHTLMTPAAEAAKDAVPLAEHLGQVAPGRAGAHDPQHRFHKHAVVAARRAARAFIADDVT